MEGYGWTMYDTRSGGSQTIHDARGHVDVKTDFAKTADGNSWGVQVGGSLRPGAPRSGVKTAVVFHLAHEKAGRNSTKALECVKGDPGGNATRAAEASCYGKDPALGPFEFYVIGDDDNEIVEGPAVRGLQVSEDSIWKAKSTLLNITDLSKKVAKHILSVQMSF